MNLTIQAQKTNLRVGLDVGIKHFDLIEELANANKYEGTVFSMLNPTLYWISEKKISFLRLYYSSLSLESEVSDSDFSADLIDMGISYSYLRNVRNWNKFSIYIGGNLNSHLKAYNQYFRGIDENDIFESSLVNVRLSSIIEMSAGFWNIYLQPEVALMNYWSKAIPFGTSIKDYSFQTDLFRFNEFQISLFGIQKISERWEFKPEYSIWFYNYNFKKSHISRVLNQRWTIGFYYAL